MRQSTQTQSSSARLSSNNLEFNKNDSMEQVLNIPENAENKPKLLNIKNKSRKNSYEEENDKSKYMLFHHINENECKLYTNPPQCLRPQQEILLQMQCMKSALSKKEKQLENQYTDIVIDLSKNSVGKPTDATGASSIRNVGCIAETISSAVSSSNQVKQITSIDGFFNRKRGRPPKNRFVEVYKNTQQAPQAIFTSFKLQKYGLDALATSIQESQFGENQKTFGAKSGECAVEQFHLYQTRNIKCIENDLPKEKILIPTESSKICEDDNRKLEVVRATGTFFPENKKGFNMCFKRLLANRKSKTPSTKQKASKMQTSLKKNKDTCLTKYLEHSKSNNTSICDEKDLPEDLSISSKSKINQYKKQNNINENSTEIEWSPPLNIRLQQLVQAYYQHCLQQKQFKVSLAPSTGQLRPFEESSLLSNRKSIPANTNNMYEMSLFLRNVSNTVAAIATVEPENAVNNQTKAAFKNEEFLKIRNDKTPIGYVKFRFNEDCGFSRCTYRKHQTHFHCNRNDCCYSFCDKTRYATHSARHERLDSLMGDDFRQYRVNMKCGFVNCLFMSNKASSKKTSHFHCRKCTFVCSDTNKVVAHRRLHMKMECIRLAGFRKITCNENCTTIVVHSQTCSSDNDICNQLSQELSCSYNMKHTHYHCLVCNASVLSRSQFAMHKHKSATVMTT